MAATSTSPGGRRRPDRSTIFLIVCCVIGALILAGLVAQPRRALVTGAPTTEAMPPTAPSSGDQGVPAAASIAGAVPEQAPAEAAPAEAAPTPACPITQPPPIEGTTFSYIATVSNCPPLLLITLADGSRAVVHPADMGLDDATVQAMNLPTEEVGP